MTAIVQEGFPILTEWLRTTLPIVRNDSRVWQAFTNVSGLHELEARIALRFGAPAAANPIVSIEDIEEYGMFRLQQPEQIAIASHVIASFERDYPVDETREAAGRFLQAKVLHELCHWADGRDGALDPHRERGDGFERLAYNNVLTAPWDEPRVAALHACLRAEGSRPQALLRVGCDGLSLIKHFEGLRLTAYRDIAGIWTIGYGHTDGVAKHQTISEEKADVLLREDVADAETAIRSSVAVPLRQAQFDALCSWTFNLGSGSLKTSTLLKRLNAGRYEDVPDQIRRWNKATVGGQLVVVPGLVRRRNAEARLWHGVLDFR